MKIEATYTISIKLSEIFMSGNVTDVEIKKRVIEEGDKRLRHYLSGYLFDPDGKIIHKDVTFFYGRFKYCLQRHYNGPFNSNAIF